MAEVAKQAPVTIQELLISSLTQTDALANLPKKASYRSTSFSAKISEERATYRLSPICSTEECHWAQTQNSRHGVNPRSRRI